MPAPVETQQPAFTLDDLSHENGELVVRGTWSGVRGMRFMRPTLTAGGRRALATLEHKPWAPEAGRTWVAAFPWEDGELDPATASMDVAPSVTVRLSGGGPLPEQEEVPDPIAVERARFERRGTEVEHLRDELRRVTGERDRALAQRDEAERDREAAVRTRARMEAQREQAVTALEEAQRLRADAETQRDEARRQRDEVVVAYRALEQRLRAEEDRRRRAADARAEHALGTPPAATAPGEDAPAGDEPLGVKAVPAVSSEVADLVAGRPRNQFTTLDLYAFRFFGVVAAICFILLLVSLVIAFA